ncbi:MAG: class I SAM-dependent methyltransferase [Acidimicrobiia bacterium]
MRFGAQREAWNEWGVVNPLWAVVTNESGEWDRSEFYDTGRAEIDRVMALCAFAGLESRRRALDFGCGVGRCTLSLADHFEEVVGVDIAPSMVGEANVVLAATPNAVCRVNDAANLRQFDDELFDLVYSNIVLQHMERRHGLQYIREFLRVLAPGGLAIFQVPTAFPPNTEAGLARLKVEARRVSPEPVVRAYDAVNRRIRPTGMPPMEMHVYPLDRVLRAVRRRGAVELVEPDTALEPGWRSRRLVVRRI